MKTGTPPSIIGSSLIVDGTYIKITKSENILYVVHARNVLGQASASTGTTIVTFTNWDNTTIDISFPTLFSTSGSGTTWDEYVLPLQCKSFVLKTNAVGPGGGGPGDQGGGV